MIVKSEWKWLPMKWWSTSSIMKMVDIMVESTGIVDKTEGNDVHNPMI